MCASWAVARCDAASDFLIDLAASLLALWHRARLWFTTLLVVRFGFGLGLHPIPIKEKCEYDAFTVKCAESESALRALTWFYQNHDSPDGDDWRACVARFGWVYIPTHSLLLWFGDHSTGTSVEVNRIDYATGQYSIRLDGDAEFITGRVPIGGYRPAAMISRLVKRRLADISGGTASARTTAYANAAIRGRAYALTPATERIVL